MNVTPIPGLADRRGRLPPARRARGACPSSVLALACLLAVTVRAERFVPDGRIRADGITVLMACDAERSPDLVEFQPNGHGKFHVQGWQRPDQQACWTVEVPAPDEYEVAALVRRVRGGALRIQVAAGDAAVTGQLSAGHWQRVPLDGRLRLPAGKVSLTLQLSAADAGAGFHADVLAVELVRPAVRADLARDAAATRADTAWIRQAGYGFMVHWTAQSQPRRGAAKPYADAVRDFDVEGFADQMKAGGAGFVVFTTSHAQQYFPAPLAALDEILPGRTAARDLVADLAEALAARGLRLMLYHHLGSGQDPAWLSASGFWETDTRRFFAHWSRLVGAIGQRYGERLAGWWFDDGMTTYYHRSPDWRALTASARAGHVRRVVAYNPWEYPAATLFQDYHCGEGNTQPDGDGTLRSDGRGILGEERYPGLQSCATLMVEGAWGHFVRDRDIGRPRWSAEQLRAMLDAFARHGNVPIFNMEIYQEGRVSPATIALFQQARMETTP